MTISVGFLANYALSKTASERASERARARAGEEVVQVFRGDATQRARQSRGFHDGALIPPGRDLPLRALLDRGSRLTERYVNCVFDQVAAN